MEAKKIIFRVDGSRNIGLGHLIRCMALAFMLKDNFEIIFVCKEAPENIVKELISSGFLFIKINSEVEFFNIINNRYIVVLDHYGLDTNYQKKIKEIGCILVCIDDLHDKEFHADLIINHAPGVKADDYHAKPYTQFALGFEYALLRPVFLQAAKQEKIIKKIETIFICFGGSDVKNLTALSLNILQHIDQFEKIIVVVGIVYENIEELKLLIGENPKIHLYHAINEKNMLGLLTISDIAIVPSSGILLEAISAGCVIVSGMYVENQKFIYQAYKNEMCFHDAGNFEPLNLQKAITESFQNFKNVKKFFDGNSGERLLNIIKYL
ncbi:UDP-2,4-diacetamido-2,4,6-trideoxy-beta-L-altropyranose hydrolase [Flavobacterium sp. LB2P6]|uniref:UDP-2,4-diacetamido-2,4, 6-trideoxy-beta-L-altropyranose hydrolase n=1 Tax=unclassified Flavobacterium TaxID=196869 RepID=UPI003AAC9F4C